tara:strand:+ start:1413 stop:2054 length:642 start_codon:yes stop_codon:yes gene_type:complete
MKKFILLTLSLMVLTQCSQTNSIEDIEVDNPSDETTLTLNYQGLGKTSEEFVSNWNKLVNTISEDEDTILYFSMNPDNVKWTSEQREALYYSFGDTGDEMNINNVFVLNMFIIEDTVSRIEFFAPSTNDEANAQQTKLFFLLILTLSDDSLDKDGREAILTNLGLYDDVSDPKQLAGSVTKNGIQYILEPLVQNNLLFGLSLYTSFADTSGTN